jgi:hypothetical protein
MKTKTRTLFAIIFGLPLLLAIGLGFAGATLFHSGTFHLEVCEKYPGGASVGIHVPATAAHAVALVLPRVVKAQIPAEAREHLHLAQAALQALSRCPDGVFVEVESDEEIVFIEKRDGELLIRVDTRDEVVRASFPVRSVSSLLSVI